MLFNGKQLTGHTSPETAFVVADYPYGFRLRCQIRYWVETKPGFGQRFVSQTSNPKYHGQGTMWNKPKARTYATLVVMYQAANTWHVEHAVLHYYNLDERLEDFAALRLDDYQQRVIAGIRKAIADRAQWQAA